jgi:hypothetical protein
VQGLTAFLTELLPWYEPIRARWRRCGGNAAAKKDGGSPADRAAAPHLLLTGKEG